MDQATDGYHEPVMAGEVVGLLEPIADGVVVDATFGGGGHTRRLLAALPAEVTVLAIDRDPDSAGRAAALGDRVRFHQGDFRDLAGILGAAQVGEIAGALFDLGVSSRQLDDAERGFSYRHPGPLDMRMGPDADTTAEEVVNSWSQRELADVIRRYGEERFADRIARAIVQARPIADTTQLADVVRSAIPAATRRTGGHPARRTFQAIRIAVNDELGALQAGLDAALAALRAGGRLVVVAYHSLEDRIVKQRFAAGARGCVCPPDLPVCGCGKAAELRILTRRVVRPSEQEIQQNPRARSARLRAVERVAA